jgi:hypothetical protein
MNLSSAPFHVVGKLLEVIIEVGHHLALEGVSKLAQALEAGNLDDGLQAMRVQPQGGRAIGFLEMGILERLIPRFVNFVAVNAGAAHLR